MMKLVLLNFLSLRKAVILGFDTDWYIDIFIFCLQNCSDPLWENNVQVSQTYYITGKSFSEALIFASTNQQYDDRLFIDLRVQYMKIPSSEHVKNLLCTQIVFCFSFYIQNNLCTQNVLGLFWAWNFQVLNL